MQKYYIAFSLLFGVTITTASQIPPDVKIIVVIPAGTSSAVKTMQRHEPLLEQTQAESASAQSESLARKCWKCYQSLDGEQGSCTCLISFCCVTGTILSFLACFH